MELADVLQSAGEATVTIRCRDLPALAALILAHPALGSLDAQLEPEASTEEIVDAKTLAGILGVQPRWVYVNAEKLGAIRLSDRPKARIRFNVATARANFCSLGRESDLSETPMVEPKRRGRPRRVPAPVPSQSPNPPRNSGPVWGGGAQ